MKPHLALVALLATAPTIVAAQTQDLLDKGVKAYQAFQVEQARPFFQQVVSPSNPYQVSPEQRVQAFKYLGASYAVLANTDTAKIYFIAALDIDPFTDLDPAEFSESELGPFTIAKNTIFRIGVKPVLPQVIDPADATTHYQFRIVTTHRADVNVSLVKQSADSLRELLYQGANDGQRPVPWDGFLRTAGRIADSATYVLRVIATSSVLTTRQTTTEQQFFRVEQAYEPLEDTLPTLPDSMLLPARIPNSAPWKDLVKGLVVGGLAAGAPALFTQGDIDWQLHAAVGVGVGFLSGVGSFLYRRANPAIPENVAENTRRLAQRQRFNDEVRTRNNAKLAKRTLVITPLTGASGR